MIKINDNEMMTIDEVVEYTGYRLSYLYKLSSQNVIRHYTRLRGRKLFFEKGDIIAFMKGILVKNREEIIRDEQTRLEFREVKRKSIKKYQKPE